MSEQWRYFKADSNNEHSPWYVQPPDMTCCISINFSADDKEDEALAKSIAEGMNELTSLRNQVAELQGKLDEITELYNQNEESNKAVELALSDVPYTGSYADGVMFLKGKLDEIAKQKATHSGLDKSDIVASLACDPADDPK